MYPEKYRGTKIKIIQNTDTHKHHRTHKQNVFFQQYNEFIKIMFKHQKTSSTQQVFDQKYALGLARCMGLKVNKDSFSEQNMKSREHLNQLREKVSFLFCKKISDENKDIFPTPPQGPVMKQNESDQDDQIDSS